MDIEQIKKLRAQTGAGMMDAKKALQEANGNLEKAKEVLRVKGVAKAEKRAHREAKAGVVESYVHGGKIGVLVELNCETDFVARTDDFKNLARDIAMHVAASAPKYIDPEEVPDEDIKKEKELIKKEMEGDNKPEDVMKKIIEGKIEKFVNEMSLIKQPYIKDTEKTVEELITSKIAKLGENIVVGQIARVELGG